MMDLVNLLESIFLFVNSNPLLYYLVSILLLNLCFPAAAIILFTFASFNLSLAFILCISILISSSTLQYAVSVKYYSRVINKFYPSANQLISSIDKKSSSWSQIIIRTISLPYIVQNFLCISLAPNFLNYIVINFLMASAWTTVFYFFSEAMMQSNIYTSVSIVTLIALVTVITKKYINKLEAAKK